MKEMEKLRRELSLMRHRLSDYEKADKVAENKTLQNRCLSEQVSFKSVRHRISDFEGANKVVENKPVPKKLSDGQKSERQSGSGPSGPSGSDPSLVEFADWNEFEFCTTKKGAHGPTKKECLEYYSEK